jgi:hypothetical protein
LIRENARFFNEFHFQDLPPMLLSAAAAAARPPELRGAKAVVSLQHSTPTPPHTRQV